MITQRVYHTQSNETMTIRAAARSLEVSRATFQKWITLGYVKVVEVGPANLAIRRVLVRDVERLRREA